jgi:hypothetical protein
MPLMKITRNFPYLGVTYPVGASADFPEATCQRMESARPPYGLRISDGELEALTAPHAGFDGMTKTELVAYADEHGIEVSSSWTKARLLDAVSGGGA